MLPPIWRWPISGIPLLVPVLRIMSVIAKGDSEQTHDWVDIICLRWTLCNYAYSSICCRRCLVHWVGPYLVWTRLIDWRMMILCCTKFSWTLTPTTACSSPAHRCRTLSKNSGLCFTSSCLKGIAAFSHDHCFTLADIVQLLDEVVQQLNRWSVFSQPSMSSFYGHVSADLQQRSSVLTPLLCSF